MRCDECDHWLVAKITSYDDGSVVDNYRAPEGNGHCEVHDKDFAAAYFCADFKESGWDHLEKKHKAGAPWQYWVLVKCPECEPVGHSVGCNRCAGTGQIRLYDDGFLGNNQTLEHPVETAKRVKGPPKCVQCSKDLDPMWINCPWCGARTNKPSPPEIIKDEVLAGVQGTTDELMQKMLARKHGEAA
jgi:hypothetical protein